VELEERMSETLKQLILKEVAMFIATGLSSVTAAQVSKSLKRLGPSVRRAMAQMVKAGKLERRGDGYTFPNVKRLAPATCPAPVSDAPVGTGTVSAPEPAPDAADVDELDSLDPNDDPPDFEDEA
jgi:hypothetical protein